MAKKDWPRKVKVGNVTVTIYRIAHGAARGGFVYELYYREGGVSRKQQFTDIDEADREARLVATKLNSGQVAASGMTKTDRDELDAIRRMTGDTPALAAVREWKKAAELTSGNVLVAAESWVARNQRKFDPIKAEDAVVRFIKETDARGAQGSRTYGAKLAPLKAYHTALQPIGPNARSSVFWPAPNSKRLRTPLPGQFSGACRWIWFPRFP